jgi:hypothetical protein
MVRLADRTLEWDLAVAGNADLMLDALTQVKPVAGPRLRASIADATEVQQADAILEKLLDVKGRFAQELAELLQDGTTPFIVPSYLREAIEWVTESPVIAGSSIPEPPSAG